MGGGVVRCAVVVDNRNMLVLEPDLLLAPSGIALNTECARRFILKTGGRRVYRCPARRCPGDPQARPLRTTPRWQGSRVSDLLAQAT